MQAATSAVWSVSADGVDLTVTEEMKVLGVVLDRHQSFDSYVTAVTSYRACKLQPRASRPSYPLSVCLFDRSVRLAAYRSVARAGALSC